MKLQTAVWGYPHTFDVEFCPFSIIRLRLGIGAYIKEGEQSLPYRVLLDSSRFWRYLEGMRLAKYAAYPIRRGFAFFDGRILSYVPTGKFSRRYLPAIAVLCPPVQIYVLPCSVFPSLAWKYPLTENPRLSLPDPPLRHCPNTRFVSVHLFCLRAK